MLTNITKQAVIEFKVDSFGLYAIEITARCEKKNDLKVKIDNLKFREIPPENNIQSYNIPANWNGTTLKGLNKTIFFILTLNKGKHTLKFTPKDNAVIEGWGYNLLTNTHTINFENLPQVEDRDKRPLCSFILVNIPLKSVTADVSVSWHLFDGDDVKLIIDNKIEQNTKSKFWKNWVWHSSLRQVFTGIKRESKTFIKNLPTNTHYIEFWTDRTPTLHKVTLDLGDYNPKRIPTVEDPEWTGDFAYDTDQMILARAIFGEARDELYPDIARIAVGWSIRNRIEESNSTDSYYNVITRSEQFSAFNLDDDNRPYVENPFWRENKSDKIAWDNCFVIAGKIINGELEDPTKGANHYYDDSIPTPYWAIAKTEVMVIENLDGTAKIRFHKL